VGLFAGERGGGVLTGESFALQKLFGVHLEGSLPLKMRDFTSESAAPEGMWVQCGGIELPCNLIQSVCFQEVQAQYHEKCNYGLHAIQFACFFFVWHPVEAHKLVVQ